MTRFFSHRWMHFMLLCALLLGAVYYSGSGDRWRKEMQSLVFDELNALYPREGSDDVVIVDLDDDSLLEIGQWPWPRTKVAALVTNLTALGAKVIAFDGVLAEPDRSSPRRTAENLPDDTQFDVFKEALSALPDHDDILADAIAQSKIFVSGFTYSSYSQAPREPSVSRQILIKKSDKQEFLENTQRFKTAAVFLPNLEAASAGNGSFMANPDFDGVLRRTGLIFNDGETLYPSLSLEAIRVADEDKKIFTRIRRNPESEKQAIDTNYYIEVGRYEIPVENDGRFWVYYRPFDRDNYISAHKIINPAYHDEVRARIKDKVILIGSSAEGLKDLRSTALEPFQPGVEIHANVVEQILQGKYLLRPDITIYAEATFILFAGLLMIVLAPFIHVLLLGAFCVTLIGIAFFGSATAYVEHGILFDPFYSSLSVFLIFIVSTLLTYLRVESEKKQVRSAFGMYVAPDVMRDLERNPENLTLGGENKELSVMFTDIRGFTGISEGLNPEELINLMNDFLTAMSDIVLEHGGTIDKYMGDAMMAFWNAPRDIKDHERQACITALKMQNALEPINDTLGALAEAQGTEALFLEAGIGINTGPCAVGNMGSHQRFAYSALGDAVNLASRLEGQTKTYGVKILIGENTVHAVSGMAVLELDLLRVKGKNEPVRIYAVIGDEHIAAREDFQTLKTHHDEMIKAYQAGEFKDAQSALKTCLNVDVYDLSLTYDLYKDRIRALMKSPPEGAWDGVYDAKTK